MIIDEFITPSGYDKPLYIAKCPIVKGKKHGKRFLINCQCPDNIVYCPTCRPLCKYRFDNVTLKQYRSFVVSLTNKTYAQHQNIINPNNLDRKQYHLDHKIPIRECYDREIEPCLVASVRNLQMLLAADNIKKGDKRLGTPFGVSGKAPKWVKMGRRKKPHKNKPKPLTFQTINNYVFSNHVTVVQ